MSKSAESLFASRTLLGHLLRGAFAMGMLALAFSQQDAHPFGALTAGVLAVVAMRGCPMCWAMGLVETLQQRKRR